MANPNPSPATRFGAPGGNPNNLGGKTAEQRKLDYEAADMAARLRHRALSVLLEQADASPLAILDVIDAAHLKLIKDSEDRAYGTPTSIIAGDPDRPVVHRIERAIVRPDD